MKHGKTNLSTGRGKGNVCRRFEVQGGSKWWSWCKDLVKAQGEMLCFVCVQLPRRSRGADMDEPEQEASEDLTSCPRLQQHSGRFCPPVQPAGGGGTAVQVSLSSQYSLFSP